MVKYERKLSKYKFKVAVISLGDVFCKCIIVSIHPQNTYNSHTINDLKNNNNNRSYVLETLIIIQGPLLTDRGFFFFIVV